MFTYMENLPAENLGAMLVVLLVILIGPNKRLPAIVLLFYVIYMAIDFAFYGPGPDWNELTTRQETQFNFLCVLTGFLIILLCVINLQHDHEKLLMEKVLLPDDRKAVYRWSSTIVTACYAAIVAVFWVLPFAMQLLSKSYTWPIHAAIMDNMIYLDLGCVCLAQVGRPYKGGLKDRAK